VQLPHYHHVPRSRVDDAQRLHLVRPVVLPMCFRGALIGCSLGLSTFFWFFFWSLWILCVYPCVLALVFHRFYSWLAVVWYVVHLCVLFLIVGANNAHECYSRVLWNHIRVIALPSGTTRSHDNWMESRVMPTFSYSAGLATHHPSVSVACLPLDCASPMWSGAGY